MIILIMKIQQSDKCEVSISNNKTVNKKKTSKSKFLVFITILNFWKGNIQNIHLKLNKDE